MRVEASITSVSWIPSEAMSGPLRVPLDLGIGRYDDPPPDTLDDLAALHEEGRFRFANELRAWAEIVDSQIVDGGYSGRGYICPTELSVGVGQIAIAAVSLPDLQLDPVIDERGITFTQTTGGRTGAPLPRRITKPPFFRLTAPPVWTTLELTIRPDGQHSSRVAGASSMPRHWFYDITGVLTAKSGIVDFADWARNATKEDTPWGGVNSPALVTAVATALERELSLRIMREGAKPAIRDLVEGAELTTRAKRATSCISCSTGSLTSRSMVHPSPRSGQVHCWGSGLLSRRASARRRCEPSHPSRSLLRARTRSIARPSSGSPEATNRKSQPVKHRPTERKRHARHDRTNRTRDRQGSRLERPPWQARPGDGGLGGGRPYSHRRVHPAGSNLRRAVRRRSGIAPPYQGQGRTDLPHRGIGVSIGGKRSNHR